MQAILCPTFLDHPGSIFVEMVSKSLMQSNHLPSGNPRWKCKIHIDAGYTIGCLYFLQGGFPLPSWLAGKVHRYRTLCLINVKKSLANPVHKPLKHLCQSRKIRVRRTSQKKNNKHLRGLEDKHSPSPGRRSPPLLGNVWKRNHFLIETFGMANERCTVYQSWQDKFIMSNKPEHLNI